MPESVAVFRNGEDGYPFFRIPSLLRVGSTLLLAFAEGRQQRSDHGSVDIVLKRSTDGGKLWSDLVVAVGGANADEGRQRRAGTAGNPTPLYDSAAAEVVLFFCRENAEIHSSRSRDEGATWSTPSALAGWSRPADWRWLAVGPPGALVTRAGRWLLPCDGFADGARFYDAKRVFSFVLVSDDRGASWRSSELLDGGNECQAAELDDNTLLLNMRSRDSKRLYSASADGGDTWSAPAPSRPAVRDGNCQGSMISLRGGSALIATSTAGVTSPRSRLTAYVSTDRGATWRTHALVEPGPAAYSSLAELSDGEVGCLYEARETVEREAARDSAGAAVAGRGGRGKPKEVEVLRFERLDVSGALDAEDGAAGEAEGARLARSTVGARGATADGATAR